MCRPEVILRSIETSWMKSSVTGARVGSGRRRQRPHAWKCPAVSSLRQMLPSLRVQCRSVRRYGAAARQRLPPSCYCRLFRLLSISPSGRRNCPVSLSKRDYARSIKTDRLRAWSRRSRRIWSVIPTMRVATRFLPRSICSSAVLPTRSMPGASC